MLETLETRQLLATDLMMAVPLAEASAKIVNGSPTSLFPSVGVIGDQSGGFCTGTLISNQHVLTAAHCAEGVGNTNGTFRLGNVTYGTSAVHVHPGWNGNALGTDQANDIAIYTLANPVTNVVPSEIFRGTPAVGQTLTLVGYGAGGTGTGGHNGDFGTLRVGTTPIDSVSSTLIAWNFDDNSESNTAPGDSGGPAFVTVGSTLFVAGITSGGDRADAGIGDHSFDTRVDAYQTWIDSITGNSGGGDGGGGGGGGGGTGTGLDFTNDTRVTIDPNSTGTVHSSILVSNVAGTVSDVNVVLDIDHTWDSDLVITLVSPGGTRVELIDGLGGSGDDFAGTVLDDEAAVSITEASVPFSGTFRPQNLLAALDGQDPNGIWTLEIRDTYLQDGGALNSWSLSLEVDDGAGGGGGGGDQGQHDFHNDTPLRINPYTTSTGTSTIDVRGVPGRLTDVNVTLDISHTWNEDLVVVLISPSGTRVRLFGGIGGSSDNFFGTTLDDEASISIQQGVAPYSGNFRPQRNLARLDGEDPNGTWKLRVRDTFAADGGWLHSWQLSFTTDAPRRHAVSEVSAFQIDLRFSEGNLTASQQAMLEAAADGWESIIRGDVPDVVTDLGIVDDIVIDVRAENIDGVGQTLGEAGPTWVRPESWLPARGFIALDTADLSGLQARGELLDVAMHEIGHALGLGTIWSQLGLLNGAGTAAPFFVGSHAMSEFAALLGADGPLPVPVESSGDPGTAGQHWSISAMAGETMSGFYHSRASHQISRITIAALADMGYQVDLDARDTPFVRSQRTIANDGNVNNPGSGSFDGRSPLSSRHRKQGQTRELSRSKVITMMQPALAIASSTDSFHELSIAEFTAGQSTVRTAGPRPEFAVLSSCHPTAMAADEATDSFLAEMAGIIRSEQTMLFDRLTIDGRLNELDELVDGLIIDRLFMTELEPAPRAP